ncbi:MAG: helix-turn-helix domain-containing protein [Thermodesulfobacteriota bacterium]|nr:helix-turn-helix domain-containing protein [Thermodesulfobacteriota bacterium]
MKQGEKPHGRDEVITAILEAAAQLFAEHGVEAVSLREIAGQANINHGLIHRHFGSKENLRLAVQDHLAALIRDDIGTPSSAMDGAKRAIEALYRHEAFWRVLARTFLDGRFEGDVQSAFPFVWNQVELVKKEQENGQITRDADPRMIVAGGTAMTLGLLVFEKYILPGSHLDREDRQETISRIFDTWADLVMKK